MGREDRRLRKRQLCERDLIVRIGSAEVRESDLAGREREALDRLVAAGFVVVDPGWRGFVDGESDRGLLYLSEAGETLLRRIGDGIA